jgi:hypothetical protein
MRWLGGLSDCSSGSHLTNSATNCGQRTSGATGKQARQDELGGEPSLAQRRGQCCTDTADCCTLGAGSMLSAGGIRADLCDGIQVLKVDVWQLCWAQRCAHSLLHATLVQHGDTRRQPPRCARVCLPASAEGVSCRQQLLLSRRATGVGRRQLAGHEHCVADSLPLGADAGGILSHHFVLLVVGSDGHAISVQEDVGRCDLQRSDWAHRMQQRWWADGRLQGRGRGVQLAPGLLQGAPPALRPRSHFHRRFGLSPQ